MAIAQFGLCRFHTLTQLPQRLCQTLKRPRVVRICRCEHACFRDGASIITFQVVCYRNIIQNERFEWIVRANSQGERQQLAPAGRVAAAQ